MKKWAVLPTFWRIVLTLSSWSQQPRTLSISSLHRRQNDKLLTIRWTREDEAVVTYLQVELLFRHYPWGSDTDHQKTRTAEPTYSRIHVRSWSYSFVTLRTPCQFCYQSSVSLFRTWRCQKKSVKFLVWRNTPSYRSMFFSPSAFVTYDVA